MGRSPASLRLRLLAAVIPSAAGFSWLWFAPGQEEARLALGRSLYVTHCASCNGAKLEGQPDWQERRPDGRMPAPPHDASGHTWHHSDQALFLITKKGLGAVVPDYQGDMPAFEGVLADTEIQAILDFIKSNWPERQQEYQEARSRAEVRKSGTLGAAQDPSRAVGMRSWQRWRSDTGGGWSG